MASRPKCAQNLHLFIDLSKKIKTACRNLGMVLLLLLRVELCKFQQCEICMFNSAFMMFVPFCVAIVSIRRRELVGFVFCVHGCCVHGCMYCPASQDRQ